MAIWMQAGNVALDRLSADQVDQLERTESTDWVEVTDGDWSAQYVIDLDDVIGIAKLVARINSGEVYGYVVANEKVDNLQIEVLRGLLDADRGDEESRPSPFSMGGDSDDHIFLFEAR